MSGTLASSSSSQGSKPFPPSPTLSSALSLSQTLGLASGSGSGGGSSSSGAHNEAGLALTPYSSAALGADPNAGGGAASPFDLGSFGLASMDDFGGGASAAPTPAAEAPSSSSAAAAGVDSINMYASTASKGKSTAPAASPRNTAEASGSVQVPSMMTTPVLPAPTPSGLVPTKTNPFLNKLRSMVEDPKTDELIRWGATGDTFVVPNNIRFGDEVLPRFFKHNRFTSFVRQLNMYGFHKVPNLQAGALKHDTPQEAELWEFRNPFFQRDRPELMAYVSRRKNNDAEAKRAGSAGGGAAKGKGKAKASTPATTTNEAAAQEGSLNAVNGALMRNNDANDAGALQLASVWQAIQSIQSAQKGINDNLRHLHNTNNDLRREALEQRQRSKKQQDTINKMLRFLAGVFGAQDGAAGVAAGGGGLEQGSSARAGGGSGAAASAASRAATGTPTTARRRMPGFAAAPRLRISDGTAEHANVSPRVQDEELNMLESITDTQDEYDELASDTAHHDDEGDSSMRFIEEAISNSGSPSSQNAANSPDSSRFVNLTASPPAEAYSELPHVSEATSTPGGSGRRLSQQAGKQIIEALSSSQGSDWLATLFGGDTLGAAGASTPGGGFKLDQSTLGALQSVLNSATAGGAASANAGGGTGGGGATSNEGAAAPWEQNYFSPTVATEEDEEARFSEWTNGITDVDSSEAKTAAAYKNKWSNGIAGASKKPASSSTALVQSPGASLLNFGTAPPPSGTGAAGTASMGAAGIPGLTPSQQAQLALTLQRASQSLQGASGDAATVQSAINVLIDGLRQDPALAAAQHTTNVGSSASAAPATTTTLSNDVAPYEQADSNMYDAVPQEQQPMADVDMDMLLREFLNAGGTLPDVGTSSGAAAQPQIEEASSNSSGRETGAANSPTATTGKDSSAGSSPGASGATTNMTQIATTATGTGKGRAGRKRAPPPEFEGVLGADIEMANAKARRRRIGEDA